MVQDALTWLDGLVVHGFLHEGGQRSGQFIRLLPSHTDSERPLRVNIYQQNLFPLHSQTDAQIFTGSGLGRAAFLVDDGDCGCFLCDNITPLSENHEQSCGCFD
jgi:hypothetical protein